MLPRLCMLFALRLFAYPIVSSRCRYMYLCLLNNSCDCCMFIRLFLYTPGDSLVVSIYNLFVLQLALRSFRAAFAQ